MIWRTNRFHMKGLSRILRNKWNAKDEVGLFLTTSGSPQILQGDVQIRRNEKLNTMVSSVVIQRCLTSTAAD